MLSEAKLSIRKFLSLSLSRPHQDPLRIPGRKDSDQKGLTQCALTLNHRSYGH